MKDKCCICGRVNGDGDLISHTTCIKCHVKPRLKQHAAMIKIAMQAIQYMGINYGYDNSSIGNSYSRNFGCFHCKAA